LEQENANFLEIATEEADKRDAIEQERDQLKRERDEALLRAKLSNEDVEHWLDDGGCLNCDCQKEAYRQGAEAFREAAAIDTDTYLHKEGYISAALRVARRIRALPVPERGK
jgi:hypothetical protein